MAQKMQKVLTENVLMSNKDKNGLKHHQQAGIWSFDCTWNGDMRHQCSNLKTKVRNKHICVLFNLITQHFVYWNEYVSTNLCGDFLNISTDTVTHILGFFFHIPFQSMYILLSVLKL